MCFIKPKPSQSVTVAICLVVLSIAKGINIKDVEEGPCFNVPVDQSFDLLWVSNYAEWYNPIISKYSIYKWVVALTGLDEKDITEDMVNRSCMILYVGGVQGSINTAFRGTRKITIDPYTADHGIYDWTQKKQDGSAGYRGRTYISLTDNDKYYVSITCWEKENQSDYDILSNNRILDEESKNTIRNHLRSLGFEADKYWVDMQYDDCIDLSDPQEYIRTTTIAPSQNKTDFEPSIPATVNQTVKSNNNSELNTVRSNSSNSLYKSPNSQPQLNYPNSFPYQINKYPLPNNRDSRRLMNYPNHYVLNSQNNFETYPTGSQNGLVTLPHGPENPISSSNVISTNTKVSNIPKGLANPPANRMTPASEYFFDIFRTMINYFQKLYGDIMKNVLRVTVRVISRMGLGSILL